MGNVVFWFEIFSIALISERRKSSLVSISGEDHGVKSVGNMSRSISRLGKIFEDLSESKMVGRGRTWQSSHSSR